MVVTADAIGGAERSTKVSGYCPMGCGPTLFLGSGGYVTCSLDVCPQPDAASEILADGEAHHIVKISEAEFTVRHPLRERLNDELMRCSLHAWTADHGGPPKRIGTYRVLTPTSRPYRWGGARWEPMPSI